jgi:nucleotide-binding universal stress UspA family protein
VPFATSILVPTDLSPASHAALDEAARISRECGAKVTVLHVFDAGPWALPPSVSNPESTLRRIVEEATGAAQSVLLALRERYFPGDPNVMLRTVEHSSAAQAICNCARDWGADLIVIASHGRTGPSSPGGVGSVSDKVVRGAGCRVLVVPSRDPQDFAH